MDATEAFQQYFRGKTNFMTPTLIERGKTGRYYWELSRGRGISGDTIYGVTVLSQDTTGHLEHEQELSTGGIDLEEAKAYIAELHTIGENRDRLVLKENMDKAISAYIARCTGSEAANVDYSSISTDIDEAIDMLGGEPAKEQ